MLIGYARVSKADGSQAHDLQRDALVAAGITADQIYEDSASGRRDDRPGLDACLKALRAGDTLVIWKLDRLGRDLRHLVNTVGELTTREIGLRVLTGEGASIDTTTANGRLIFGIFAALAEFERELIVERTKAGLAAARAREERRTAIQDDASQASPRAGGDGKAGNRRGRPLCGNRDYSANTVPVCRSQGRIARRRRAPARSEENWKT